MVSARENACDRSFDSNIGIWEQEDVNEDEVGAGEWECITVEGHETECKVWHILLLVHCWLVVVGIILSGFGKDVLMEHAQDVKYVVWHPTEEVKYSLSETKRFLLVHSLNQCRYRIWFLRRYDGTLSR
jgi:hypothetical protein